MIIFLLLFFILDANIISCADIDGGASKLQSYIIQVKQPKELVLSSTEDFRQWHISLLESTASSAVPRLYHSYDTVMNGFAARLNQEELDSISKAEWFVYAHQNNIQTLETTHSNSFLGLNYGQGFWNISNYGKGVVIGVVDNGGRPDHPSFDDDGMPPPPPKYTGGCDFLPPYSCNNKIIGARTVVELFRTPTGEVIPDPPLDNFGHATMTASVATGRLVKNASAGGNALGSAVGVAPLAHLAVYKVCHTNIPCEDADILQGINTAVRDGVDILSLSLGGPQVPLYMDLIAIGTLGAIEKGVFVSKSAGNFGPGPSSVTSVGPWVLSVAAGTIDRSIRATVKLGNGKEFDGESLYQSGDFGSAMLPLVYPGANGDPNVTSCMDEKFGGVDIKGKIVLCEGGNIWDKTLRSTLIKNANGAGMILMNDATYGYSKFPQEDHVPSSHVDHQAGLEIKAYLKSTQNPTATIIQKGTIIGGIRAPTIPSFSSKGPSLVSPAILKPDITGPGVGILGAFPNPGDSNLTTPKFVIRSGTSLSCPQLAGVAALLKSAHPDWTPAMIKSAIMTTADVLDNTGNPIIDETGLPASYFAMGAGHVNPTKANDPGLVYDIKPEDYLRYICGLGYNNSMINYLAKHSVNCEMLMTTTDEDLNYPSITVPFTPTITKFSTTREVTNVGEAVSTYWADIEMPEGVELVVQPTKLSFTQLNEKQKFKLTFTKTSGDNASKSAQGYIKWVSTNHVVCSPISIIFDQPPPLN
ncbi:hypothetical protein J5N97_019803 [Dioscorea zingiberensis]|uniref:Uncharacterized protein n=1 Tax=Dioscorea zingiberensis TaxID=325984 RepID=A0A9D5CF91_9LILI|nr:hypothetical protein J5N97_019803 [Dioscorea zingiberensis]